MSLTMTREPLRFRLRISVKDFKDISVLNRSLTENKFELAMRLFHNIQSISHSNGSFGKQLILQVLFCAYLFEYVMYVS